MTKTEIKKLTDKVLKATKPMFKTLDTIDKELHDIDTEPNEETLKAWARRACGAGNYIEKKYLFISAMKKNEEYKKYESIKLSVSVKNEKFVSAIADREAKAFTADLRLTRDILEAYVNSANRILSVIRLHMTNKQQGHTFDAHL